MAAQQTAVTPPPALDDPALYLNRELSLLAFQRRVLDEAEDRRHPLLERAKFLSILFSNLDEFFMVRVAGLVQKLESGKPEISIDGKSVTAQLEAIRAEVTSLVDSAYWYYRDELLPALDEARIHIVDYAALDDSQREKLEAYFIESVFPVLTPLAFDPGRPFPHMSSLSLNIAAVVKDVREHFARVKVPDTLSQLVRVPTPAAEEGEYTFIWMEQLIGAHLRYLFPGLEIVESHAFHITRDAEVAIQEVESDDLLETVEEAVWRRRFRDVVRLQVHANMNPEVLQILISNLELEPGDVYTVHGTLDLSRIRHLLTLDRPDLKDKPIVPYTQPGMMAKGNDDVFLQLRQGDVLVHHPFDSFQPVVELLRKAAKDPDVLAIKMTLYRTGHNSPLVAALLEAIEQGKQVAVLVELKARFDEESNIEWARAMEREGVHVVYGLLGLKVHAKLCMIVRREGDMIRRYIHMATGNYNSLTARLYTDLGLFTTNPQIAADVTDLFNYLTGYSAKSEYRKLLVAPINLRQRFMGLIEREMIRQSSGRRGHIILKVNALEDKGIIEQLYRASQAGVHIDLLVRGICCLRPGVPGVSENIRVVSILGRFLEHSRIYYFHNGGDEEIYLGSADLMPRNLNRRVEVIFPVEETRLKKRVKDEILATYLADNARARIMHPDGVYTRAEHSDTGLDAQSWLVNANTTRS